MKKAGFVLGGMILGAAVGGALGVLYAPATGKRTRKRLEKEFTNFEKDLKKTASKKMTEVKKDLNEKLEDYTDTGKKMVNDLKSSLNLS